MAWKVVHEARVVKCDETGRVGILTEQGGDVNVLGSGEGSSVDTTALENDIKKNADDIKQNKTDISSLKESVEFTPRLIGMYNAPWLIEGQGNLTVRVFQLQKNVFSVDVNGGGSPCALDGSALCELPVSIPIRRYNPQDMVPYCSPARFGVNDGEVVIGMVGFSDGILKIDAPKNKQYTSIALANIIVYGELIEDETA